MSKKNSISHNTIPFMRPGLSFALFFIGLCCFVEAGFSQQAYKMNLLGHYNDSNLRKVDVTDIWNDCTGWYDSVKQREYAIAGTTDSIYFFDITDPAQMKLVDREWGSSSLCRNRDYEVYQHYVYCVADQGQGDGVLQIFDLKNLPDSVYKVYQSGSLGQFTHTIFIEAMSKRLYMCSNTTFDSGTVAMDILSLNNPEFPTFLAHLDVPHPQGVPLFSIVHEMYARTDTSYCSCDNAGLFIFDLRDLSNQKLIGSITSYPKKGYNHSSWLDESGRYIMFTDENAGLDAKIFDIADLNNPHFVSVFNSNPGAMPHNAYWKGKFAYVSAYHDGVRIWNVHDPEHPVQVAWYDTHPQEPEVYGGYKGCWGVWPYLPSGHIIASDLTSGIFVFGVDSLDDIADLKREYELN